MQCSHCAGCSLTASQALTSSIQQRAGEAYKSEIVLKERVGAEQCGPAGNEFTFLVFSQCLASECLASRCSPWLCLDGYLCPGHSFKRSRGLALWGKWWHAHPKGVVGGGRQRAHRAAPALHVEILGQKGEMSSLKWHCSPQRGLLPKQTVCSALRREPRAARLQQLFKI